MATHSRVLAWRIPGTGGPSGLPSMGLHRVGHDWSDLAAAAAANESKPRRRSWDLLIYSQSVRVTGSYLDLPWCLKFKESVVYSQLVRSTGMTSACNWLLACMRPSCRTEPLICGIWCFLWVDTVRIELNSQTPFRCLKNCHRETLLLPLEFGQDTKRKGIKISLSFWTPAFTAALLAMVKRQK